jgi:hypothetical protein
MTALRDDELVEVGSGVIVDAPAELRDRFLLLFIPCVAQPL